MNKLTNLKALLLFAFFALFLLNPASLNAQKTDGFFHSGNDNYENRATIDDDGGMGHWGIGETVPVGSGLLILTAIGAGYAIARRKKHCRDASNASKFGILLLAFALILGMTNCKKKAETIQSVAENNGVKITLNIEGDNSKVIVDPTNGGLNDFASVNYEVGDIIYVGYDNDYVGYLTYVEDSEDGNHFTGSVNIPSAVGEHPLHFYFLGGKDVQPDPSAVINNELSVVISDQTSKYPVISYAHSKQPYSTENTKYTAKLLSKCSIMKFNVVTPSSSPICIMGMNNKVTVDFTNPGGDDNGFTYSKYQNIGEIKMTAGAGEKWAIVLPQPALDLGAHEAYTSIAEVMSSNEDYLTGSRCAIPEIGRNQYLSDATDRTITVNETPSFTVNEDGLKVLFAPGNLKATTNDGWSTWTWSFMENQYSLEEQNGEVGDDYSKKAVVSLFKWSFNGENGRKPNCTSPVINSIELNHDYDTLKGTSDWGSNANAVNLGYHNDWRTPTITEFEHLLLTRKVHGNHYSYGYGRVAGVKGLVVLPDNWNGAIHPDFIYGVSDGNTNTYSSSTTPDWETMEKAGVVFLPAAGYGYDGYVDDVGDYGCYWSSSYKGTSPAHNNQTQAYVFSHIFYENDGDCVFTGSDWTYFGSSVRLIRNIPTDK